MSEFRRDRTTGEWSIIAPERGKRPHERKTGRPDVPRIVFDPSCPFCPGNERMLPPIVEETDGTPPPGWRTRVVQNKYPLLSITGEPAAGPPGPGYGRHEVIIETHRHDWDLPDLPPADMAALVDTWHRRLVAGLSQPGIETAQLFRNRGKDAGASIGHAHSQLVALPFMPPRMEAALSASLAFRQAHGQCATCAELDREIASGRRVVELTEDFALLVPYAARCPFEQWIVPRRHRSGFAHTEADERAKFGKVLQGAIGRLKSIAGEVAYNLVFEPGSQRPEHSDAAHWSLRIVPDLVTPGGFELGSGIAVNPSSPEDDASRLRDAAIADAP